MDHYGDLIQEFVVEQALKLLEDPRLDIERQSHQVYLGTDGAAGLTMQVAVDAGTITRVHLVAQGSGTGNKIVDATITPRTTVPAYLDLLDVLQSVVE